MNYQRFIATIPAFQKLVIQDLPLPVAYKLSKLVRKVNEELEFFQAENAKIRKKHEDPNSPGIKEDTDALLGLNVEWDVPPIEIKLDDNLRLSCSDIDALDGFVIFKE